MDAGNGEPATEHRAKNAARRATQAFGKKHDQGDRDQARNGRRQAGAQVGEGLPYQFAQTQRDRQGRRKLVQHIGKPGVGENKADRHPRDLQGAQHQRPAMRCEADRRMRGVRRVRRLQACAHVADRAKQKPQGEPGDQGCGQCVQNAAHHHVRPALRA